LISLLAKGRGLSGEAMFPGGRHEAFYFVRWVASLSAEGADIGDDSPARPAAHRLGSYTEAKCDFASAEEVVSCGSPDPIARYDHITSIRSLNTIVRRDAYASNDSSGSHVFQ